MNKVLVLLPDKNDIAETSKLDKSRYEVHFLHLSEEAATKSMSLFDYQMFYIQPQFLNSYVERAIDCRKA